MWEPQLRLICELRGLEWLIRCDILWFTADRRWCVLSYVIYREWLVIFCMTFGLPWYYLIQYGPLMVHSTQYSMCFIRIVIGEIHASLFPFLSVCCTKLHMCEELWITVTNLDNTLSWHLVIRPRHTYISNQQTRNNDACNSIDLWWWIERIDISLHSLKLFSMCFQHAAAYYIRRLNPGLPL